MAISKTEFKNAFREVVSMEYEEIPADENSIDYCFSERFEKKMEKLIQSQKKAHWHYVNTAGKRVAVAALICLMLFTTACGIKPVREAVAGFIRNIYERFSVVFVESAVKDSISYVYRIERLPEGYEEVDSFQNLHMNVTTYEDKAGNVISFVQSIRHNGFYVDNEGVETYTVAVDEKDVLVYEDRDYAIAIWVQDGYFMHLECFGQVDIEIIELIIGSIR